MSAGLLGQFGLASETVWGTGVTPTKFLGGWLSGNPVREQPPLISQGIKAGRRLPSCISTGAKTVQGSVEMELTPVPLSTLHRHMFGTIAAPVGAGPYVHTASIGPLNGKSFTGQWGIPGTAGTVHPFTMPGSKIQGWTRKATAGEIATQTLDITAKDYVTATALASASYAASCPMTFVSGTVSVAGSQVAEVKSFEEAVKRQLRIEHYLGSTLISEQIETGMAEAMITIDAEFANLTLHDLANTQVAIVLTYDNGAGDLLVDTANAFVIPSTPTVGGASSLTSYTFKAQCLGTTDALALTSVLTNTEAANT